MAKTTDILKAKELVKQGVPIQEAAKKVRFESQTPQTPTAPIGVQTTGPKVTPELQATMKKTRLGSQPVLTAQEISAKSENRANQQQQEADRLMDLSANIDRTLGVDQPEQKATRLDGGQPTQPTQPAIPTTPTTAEKTNVQTPEGVTTTIKETPKPTGITKDTQWEDTAKDLNSLEQLVEARYGTIASQKDGKLIANIGGKDYEFSIQNGKPVKTEVQPAMKSGDIYTGLLQNPNMNTSTLDQKEVKVAQERILNYNTFKKFNAEQLLTSINTGTLIPGTTTYNDLMNDPIIGPKLEEANKLRLIKGDKIDLQKAGEQKTEEILSKPTIAQAMADNNLSIEEINEMTNTPEVEAKRKDVEAKKNKLDTIQAEYDAIETNVEEQLKGKNATSYDKAQMVANARKLIYKDLQVARSIYENAYGLYTDMKTEAVNNFTTNLGLYKDKMAEERQIAQEERAYQRSIEAQKMSQILQSGDLTSSDPFILNKGIENAVNDLYKLYPIPGMESPALKIEKVKQMIAQGMTPQEAIKSVEQEIRNSERYKSLINPPQKQTESWQKLSDNSLYNQTTGEVKNVGGTGMTANATVQTDPQSIVNNAYSTLLNQGKIKEGDTTIQCGQLTNSYIKQLTGNYGTAGDTLESKNKNLEQLGLSSVPVVGGLFTLDVGTKEGHIGIVQAINGNQFTVLEANREGKKEGGEPVIANYTISGKMKFSQAPQSQKQYTESDIELLSELANMEPSARNTALKAQGIPLKDVTDYMAKAKAGLIPPTQTQVQSSLQILSQIQDIAQNEWNDATGMWRPTLEGSDRETVRKKIDSLIANVTLPNLGMLKGPMSDKDLAFIQNASTRLAYTQSDKSFEKELVEMYNISARKAGIPTINKLSEIGTERILPGQPTQTQTPVQGNTVTGKSGTTYTLKPKK